MEQFLRDLFNDNSVCVGLCDLKRKVDEINFAYVAPQMNPQIVQQTYVNVQPQMQQQTVQPKPQKQTLAQKFAAQQQAYAQQQEYLKRQVYAQQQIQKFEQVQQQVQYAQPRTVQQKTVYSEAKPVYVNKNPYGPQPAVAQQAPQTRVIVNGNMKKVVSAAVPAQRYM